VQDPLPVWVAVGGTPRSFARAGVLGLPLTVAIIGGAPERFVPLVELYRRAGAEAGHDPASLRVAVNYHGYVAETARRAAAEFLPPYLAAMRRIGAERGWPPMTRQQFDLLRSPRGSLAVGTPEEVVEKVLLAHELFGAARFLVHPSVGTLPHEGVMRSIALFATEVAPAVRAEVARREGALAPAG